METTNLETSQKLKELGFESQTYVAYFKRHRTGEIMIGDIRDEHHINGKLFEFECKCYFLETILEALPTSINADSIYSNEYRGHANLQIHYNKVIGYNDYTGVFLISCKKENESLANTAGRLLIKLLEDNIIKLGE
jgi:hypothetical protein